MNESVSEENGVGVCLGRELPGGTDGNKRDEKACGRAAAASDTCQAGLVGYTALSF